MPLKKQREAEPAGKVKAKDKPKKRGPETALRPPSRSVTSLVDDILAAPDTTGGVGGPTQLGEEALALQIDRNLSTRIWAGTTFEDRMGHFTNELRQDLVSSMENSLLQQERYEDFEARLFKQLGLDTDEPAGALRNLETQLLGETKLAWNTAMVAAQEGTDAILVWRSALSPTTTPGCAARHGMSLDELDGETPPKHFRCQCDLYSIPNPDSDDPDTAEAGKAILDDMAAERAAWGGDVADIREEAERFRPSRFAAFREAAGDDEDGHWITTDSGAHIFIKGPAPEKSGGGKSKQTDSPAFKKWFGKSKVVDERGKPLVVYHGTKRDVSKFDIRKAGASDPGLIGSAFYFTPSPEQAGQFADSPHYGGKGAGPNVMPVYVALEHPVVIVDGVLPDGRTLTQLHPQGITKASAASVKAELRHAGYDGAIFKDSGGDITQVVAFAPTQIKSAIGNKGKFDPKNPSIIESHKPSRFPSFREIQDTA